jgi:hypothetical protein
MDAVNLLQMLFDSFFKEEKLPTIKIKFMGYKITVELLLFIMNKVEVINVIHEQSIRQCIRNSNIKMDRVNVKTVLTIVIMHVYVLFHQ